MPKEPKEKEQYLKKLRDAKLGKKMSDEFKAKRKQIMQECWKDPEFRRQMSEKKSGKNNPNYGKKMSEEQKEKIRISAALRAAVRVDRVCKICGIIFSVAPSIIRKGCGVYCSRKCMFSDKEYISKRQQSLKQHYENPKYGKIRSSKLKEHYSSEDARKKNSMALTKAYDNEETRWKPFESRIGGFWYGNVKHLDYIPPQYCEKWTPEFKERVRAFFGYKCVKCGEKQNGKKLDVHHVYYNKKACCDNTPRVLVALCHACHSKTTSGDRSYWSKYFQGIIDFKYGGRCWMTKEEYAKHIKKN